MIRSSVEEISGLRFSIVSFMYFITGPIPCQASVLVGTGFRRDERLIKQWSNSSLRTSVVTLEGHHARRMAFLLRSSFAETLFSLGFVMTSSLGLGNQSRNSHTSVNNSCFLVMWRRYSTVVCAQSPVVSIYELFLVLSF